MKILSTILLILFIASQSQAQLSFLPKAQPNEYNFCAYLSGNTWVGTVLEQFNDQSCLYDIQATIVGQENYEISISFDQTNGVSNSDEKCEDKRTSLQGVCRDGANLEFHYNEGEVNRYFIGVGFSNKIGIVQNDSKGENLARTSIGLVRGDQVFIAQDQQNQNQNQMEEKQRGDFCNDLNGSTWKGEFMWTSANKKCLWEARGTVKTQEESSQIEIDLQQYYGVNADGDDKYDPCNQQRTKMIGYCSGKNEITVRSEDWKYEGLGAGNKINLMQAEEGYPLWSVQFSLTRIGDGKEEVQ